MSKKTALITGITGQDGSFLAEFLLEQGYRVVGMTRRSSTDVHERIQHIVDDIEIVSGDLLDQSSITSIVAAVRPHEIYNLAAQSFVPTSWTQPVLTGEFTALGVTRVLEAVRSIDRGIRFYQASSSEMFGKVQAVPQNEDTPFYPRSPYGVAKVYGHWITVNYRESYDLFACSGILFNHESPTPRQGVRDAEDLRRRRADQARLAAGAAARESGCAARLGVRRRLRARDVADAAAAARRRLRDRDRAHALGARFVRLAFEVAGLDWERYVIVDPRFYRPAEVDLLVGDASKAHRELGWRPEVSFEELVERMVEADLDRLRPFAPA